MKYLKEGKWDDFQKDVKEMSYKIKQFKTDVDGINQSLLSDIKDIMVDIEEFQVDYNDSYIDTMEDDELCQYSYITTYGKIKTILDLKEKIDVYLGACADFKSDLSNGDFSCVFYIYLNAIHRCGFKEIEKIVNNFESGNFSKDQKLVFDVYFLKLKLKAKI